jgi:hypothetical protein
MLTKTLQVASALLLGAALLASAGCGGTDACASTVRTASYDSDCDGVATKSVAYVDERPFYGNDMPHARPGECFAKVFIPPKTRTVTERIMVREASDRIEVVPAQYEWVEEKVCVKEPSTHLEVVPAQYATREQTVEVEPGRTEWKMTDGSNCVSPTKEPLGEVVCLVKTPPIHKTIRTECLAKPACVREVRVAGEYSTVRRQRLKCPATTRKVTIPAEYETVQKTVVSEPGRMVWQKVICDVNASAAKANEVKTALKAKGYTPGPLNGKFEQRDWVALKTFQEQNRLAMGALTVETMNKLGVSTK